MSRTKTHKTVTITDKLLSKMGACEEARSELAPYLPAKISTNPEDNIEFVERLLDGTGGKRQGYADDVCFLGGWLAGHAYEYLDDETTSKNPYYDRAFPPNGGDGRNYEMTGDCDQRIYLAAQYLAWGADWLLVARGK